MNNDLISRSALKEQFTEGAYTSKGVREIIDTAPAVYDNPYSDGREDGYIEGYEEAKNEIPTNKWIEFARWVAKEVLDDYFDENSDSFAEIACRKLVKLGLVEDNDNVYKMKGEEE